MGYFFAPYQIVEMAMHVEEKGAEFYKYLGERNRDVKVKKIFAELSNQEINHREIFNKLALEARKIGAEYEYSINVEELLQNGIDDLEKSIFSFQSLESDKIDMRGCLELAIHAEDQAVHIYNAMKDSFIKEFQDVISQIINEEKKHLEILLKIRGEASK